MGEINMRKLICLKKYFWVGSLILLMLFMFGCSGSGGGDPFADNNYDEAGDTDSTDSSIFDGAAGAGGAAGGIGAGIALNEMAFPPSNANAQVFSATGMEVTWDASTGNNIEGYNVYRNGAFLMSVEGTGIEQGGLEPNTRYCYEIAAYNDLMESARIKTCAKTYFTRRWGTTYNDYGMENAVDADGNIYVVGYTSGNMYKTTEYNNIFLTKFNAAGVEQWTRQLNTHSALFKPPQSAMGVAVDAGGNIYVTGNMEYGEENVRVKGSSSGIDAFLTKFDTNGNILWTRMLGSNGADYGTDVALDIYGNIYISGYTDGDMNGQDTKNGSGYDMFVAMYDSNGGFRWVNQLDINGDDYGWGIAVDTIGHIYISGTTGTTSDQVRTKGSPSRDMFLASYNNAGLLEWVRSLGANYIYSYISRVAVGGDGIYVTGTTMDNLDGNHSTSTYDMFLTKYNYAGFKQWTRQLGGNSSDYGVNVAVDADGFIYVTGNAASNPFEGFSPQGKDDVFLTKYDSSGNKLWTQMFGGNSYDYSMGVAAAGGYVFLTGATFSSYFDGNSQIGNYDAFLMKYDSNGNRQ
jgi:hypothetical protein